MKNVRTDREVEERCEQFLKQMEQRIISLETQMLTTVSKTEVKDVVQGAIQKEKNQIATDSSSEVIQEAISKKVSEFRESSTREKNIIVYGVEEIDSEEGSARKQGGY